MDAASLSAATFTLSAAGAAGAAAGATVAGSVSASRGTASFTPAAALTAGTLYTATVSVGAKDAAGNALVAAHGWSFTTVASVAANAWSVPVLLETADGQAGLPAIAATIEDVPSSAAQAIAVWIQHDGTQMSVYANRFREGVWQGAVLVEDATAVSRVSAGGAGSPQVAMGAFGRAVMTWIFDDGNAGYSVWGNVYDPIPPQPATPLPFASANAGQLSFGGNASDPQVGFDGSGFDAFTVWTQLVACRWHLHARHCPPGALAACGAAQKIESLAGNAELPRLAGAPNGDAIVVWQQAEAGGGSSSIYAHHYSAAGASWAATPALIDANAGGAQIAMDKRGRASVVWSKQNDAAKTNIYASRFE